jgi:hypothetical protein
VGKILLIALKKNGVYEVQKDSLMITIRRLLNIKKNKVPLFIEPSVLFLAYVIDLRIKNLIILHGVYGLDLIVTNGVQIIIKSGISIALMLLLRALQPIIMIPNLATYGLSGVLSFVLLTSNDFKCDNYFYQLPQFIEDGISYIDRPVISNEKIYVKGHQDLPIMKLDKIPTQICDNNSEDIALNKFIELIIDRFAPIIGKIQNGSNSNLNTKTCDSSKRNYVKLEHRTKTLDDIRVENDSKNMEAVAPLIENYKKSNQKIRVSTESKLRDE